ncbi:hypothetical protein E1301_Tti007052 [Triplophysa tibetana]|uniref:Uncharacterized protein n=1 Tax=Triplophysa tibetana TaxID=1572043 RepID=A0A5A9PLI8_9TELE|nr:hypothetical protein E1301_Tti007052 [Triplophysa tibetana]
MRMEGEKDTAELRLSLTSRSLPPSPSPSPPVHGSIHKAGHRQAFGPQQSGSRERLFSPCPISADLLSVNQARAELSGRFH